MVIEDNEMYGKHKKSLNKSFNCLKIKHSFPTTCTSQERTRRRKITNRERSPVLLCAVLVVQPESVLPGVKAVRCQDVQGGDVAVGVGARSGGNFILLF